MNHSTPPSNSVYRADIDGIRAVAVLSVFLFHLHPHLLSGGFLGVDVFFVISGYLITNIILRENHTGNFSFIHFYARRVKRIFPALFVVLFLTGAVATFLLTPETYINFMRSSRYAAAQLANLFFAREVSYFDEGFTGQPLLHTWSLGVEEQFYLFWPLLIFLCFYFFSKKQPLTPASGAINNDIVQSVSLDNAGQLVNGNRKLAWILMFLSILSFGLCYTLAASHHNLAFYMFYARAWEFCVGGFIALRIIPSPKSKISQNLIGAAGLLMLCVSFVFINEDNFGVSFLRFGVILPCVGTALIIHVGGTYGLANQFLASKIPVYIGKISYSLYLYHWPVIILWKIFDNSSELGLGASLGIIAVSLLLSTMSYLFVEQPARKSTSPDWQILVGGCAVIIVFAFSFKQLEPYDLASWRITKATSGSATEEEKLPDGCTMRFLGQVKYFSCDFAEGSEDSAIALVGDSHSPHYFQASVAWAREKGYDLVFLSSPGCPMLLGDVHIKSKIGASQENQCEIALPFFEKYIVGNPRIKLIFIAQRFDLFYNGKGYLRDSWQITFKDEEGTILSNHGEYYKDKFGFTVKSIRELGKEVVILKQVPLMKGGNSCNWQPLLKQLLKKEQLCSYDNGFIKRWQEKSVDFIDDLAARHHVAALDPTPFFTTPIQGGVNIYQNQDHLNRYGREYMVEHFGDAMNTIIDQISNN